MPENTPPSELTNKDHIYAFVKAIEAQVQRSENIASKEIYELMDLFLKLHEHVNDPTTRETAAKTKAHLVQDLALQQLEQRPETDYTIELFQATHQETGVETYNVIITFGDPKSGPTTLIEVHHDTIAAGDYSLSFDRKSQALSGRTIQDNTIHLAATLQALKEITVPDEGAIIVVLTDFEENGCRGSSALKELLMKRLNLSFPAALIALESTARELAIGHRGKLSAEIHGQLNGQATADVFHDFYTMLSSVQHRIYDADSKGSILGETTGTSTYGHVSTTEGVWAKLDVRTNDVTTPEVVEHVFLDALDGNELRPNLSLHEEALKLLNQNHWSITVRDDGIYVECDTKFTHPSTFNPKENETVFPALYLIVQALKQHGLSENIESITWGEKKLMNSNPRTGYVRGTFPELSLEKLMTLIPQITPDFREYQAGGYALNPDHTIKTGSVASPDDQVIAKITQSLAAAIGHDVPNTTMNFMTDIAALFNLLKDNGIPEAYGLVFGVGDPGRLHGVESLTPQDIIDIYLTMKTFLNIVQNELYPERA